MDSEPTSFAEQAKQMAEAIERLRATVEQFKVVAQEIHTGIAFGAHPELTALDDELDIMYRGQL